jgi:hypothetical protein
VTLDQLLSGDELLSIADADTRQKENHFRDLVFDMLDISTAMFFFLPFFGQRVDGIIHEVSLLSLTGISSYMRVAYFVVIAVMVASGFLTFALQNCQWAFWIRNKSKVSILLNAVGALLFILSLQPYAAAMLFIFLMIKLLMLVYRR